MAFARLWGCQAPGRHRAARIEAYWPEAGEKPAGRSDLEPFPGWRDRAMESAGYRELDHGPANENWRRIN